MEFNNKNNDKFELLNNKKQNFTHSESIENLSYLYPNGHRITHQLRWFKGSRDRDLRSDIPA